MTGSRRHSSRPTAAIAGAPSQAEVLAELREAYRPEATYPAAFGRWLHRLLTRTGLVTIDPADARLKRLGAPLFAREIAEPGIVGRAVAGQTARLAAAGYPAQIDVREGMLTLFLHEPGRIAIEAVDGGLRLSGGRSLRDGELERILAREPERFSPNAALRPLFQDTLLPTVAMVLGPAELAYCTQLALAYERLDVPMPVLFPRASLTIIEPRIERFLHARGLTLGEAIALGPRLPAEVGRRAIPEGLAARIGAARASIAAAFEGLVGDIDRLDHSLRRTVELQAAYSARRLDLVEKKTARGSAAPRRRGGAPGRVARRSARAARPSAGAQPLPRPVRGALGHGFRGSHRARDGHLAARAPGDRGMKIDLLAFGPHPDDAEIGAGGTLLRAAEAGAKTGVVTLTRGEMGSRGGPAERAAEFDAAAAGLGLAHHAMLDLPDGRLTSDERSREAVARVLRDLRPSVVLAPYWEDRHPDHLAASRIVQDAVFLAGLARYDTGQAPHRPGEIVYYMVSWEFEPSFVVDVSAQFERKLAALRCYGSQSPQPRPERGRARDLRFQRRLLGPAVGARGPLRPTHRCGVRRTV